MRRRRATRHGDARARRVRASARGDGAREDAPLRLHRRARLRHPRRHAALRLRLERGRQRPSARRDRDRGPGRVRRAHARPGRPGRQPGRARAPRPCAPASRWPICSRTCAPRAARYVRSAGRGSRYTPQPHVQDLLTLREEARLRQQPEPLDGRHQAPLQPEPPAGPHDARTARRRAPTSARAASRPAKSPRRSSAEAQPRPRPRSE